MSNPLNEVTFEAGGKVYHFGVGFYAQAMLERKTGMTAAKFFQRPLDEFGASDILALFCAGLSRRHDLTEAQVADILDDITLPRAIEIFNEAFGLAVEKKDPSARPQKAATSGTGKKP